MGILLTLIFGLASLIALGLLTSYRHVPAAELKRRAREGDEQSKTLYGVAAYGYSLGVLLWFVAGLFGGLFFWSLVRHVPGWAAVIAGSIYMWTVLVWLPTRWPARLSLKLAVLIAPAMAALLGYLHSVLDKPVQFFAKKWPGREHTGLYHMDDLLNLLQAQAMQPDSRLSDTQIQIAMQALTFGNRSVGEIMTPRAKVKLVSADDSLGPILMAELHDSGLDTFPVYEGKKSHIVGTLFLNELVQKKATGKVKDVMHSEVYFLHEEQALGDTLGSLFQPHHHFFLVLNRFDEYVGVVTAVDILQQIIGRPVPEPQPEAEELPEEADQSASPAPTEEPSEVIE